MRLNHTQSSKWLLCLGVSFCAFFLTYWPDGLMLFRYDRAAILSGQGWRLVTGHLVHLNMPHLLVNILGLMLIVELLWNELPVIHGLALLGASILGISALLWVLQPNLQWYAGFSGALHGLWAGCSVAGFWSNSERPIVRRGAPTFANMVSIRTMSLLGIVVLIVKLGLEWQYGASMRTEQIIEAPVVTVAHLYGALLGCAYVLLWRIAGLLRGKNIS